jgi:large repetitive protein
MRFYRAASAFTVGGTLTGLPAGDTVTLQDNGSDNLTLSNNGTFTFPTALPNPSSSFGELNRQF